MNRAFKPDTHSGANYPHKGCAVRGNDTAGVDHRYFLCPLVGAYGKQLMGLYGITMPPTEDTFFCRSLQKILAGLGPSSTPAPYGQPIQYNKRYGIKASC
ncbi:hypothetical protein DSO57_1037182 [Entomophthora muscae]|uniref:Uncharacterized protein n=1 Tax=Entomophthora muscae TaxID=34485 RepID=A0ACC2SZC9_9FUNG|nr:hypothetical protein DSO57_1037182 [Entomophthora muscae]